MRSDPEVRNGVQQAQQQAIMQSDNLQEKLKELSRTTRRSRCNVTVKGGGRVGKMNDDV